MSGYQLRRQGNGYELTEPLDCLPSKRIATIEPKLDARTAALTGWRFRPVTIMNGPASKLWLTVADALIGYRITTPARARKAVAAADAHLPPLPL